MCTNVPNDSLTLQWSKPTDNGGEEELQYNITGNRSVVVNGSKRIFDDLEPLRLYSFNITAGNSVGYWPAASVNCTTEGNSMKTWSASSNLTCVLTFLYRTKNVWGCLCMYRCEWNEWWWFFSWSDSALLCKFWNLTLPVLVPFPHLFCLRTRWF